jgi:hypothetical protein
MTNTSNVIKKVAMKGPIKALIMSMSSFLITYLYYMNAAKIRLSPKEMELVMNADWILTKNSVLQKTNQLLAQLLGRQQGYLLLHNKKVPADLIQQSPKISKGDNYQGLPYLVLDHPKYFDRSGIFAIRSFFWWGNFFSVTLHLSGHFKTVLEPTILAAFPILQQQGFYCCVHTDQWQHHFERSNYVPAAEMEATTFSSEITGKAFIKLAKKIPLQQWDEVDNMLLTDFSQLIDIVSH